MVLIVYKIVFNLFEFINNETVSTFEQKPFRWSQKTLEQVKEWVGNEEMQRGKYMQPFLEAASQVKGWYVILRREGIVEKLY